MTPQLSKHVLQQALVLWVIPLSILISNRWISPAQSSWHYVAHSKAVETPASCHQASMESVSSGRPQGMSSPTSVRAATSFPRGAKQPLKIQWFSPHPDWFANTCSSACLNSYVKFFFLMLKPHRHNKENNVLETDIYNTKTSTYRIKVFAGGLRAWWR